MKKNIKLKSLIEKNLTSNDAHVFEKLSKNFVTGFTPEVVSLIQKNSVGVAKQFIPSEEELDKNPADLHDPIGDLVHNKVPGIIHRYSDRCLLLPVKVCPVYCRFCFRKEHIGPGNKMLTALEFKQAFNYISSNKNIFEVILSGGDPLVLNPNKIKEILTRLKRIEHVNVVRIHSRVPVLDTTRITDEMLNALAVFEPVYLVLHINHPDEMHPGAIAAIKKLHQAGIVLLSQTVLLKGVNDDVSILGNLMKKLVVNKVKPYYLHHLDHASGTEHFRVSIEKGQEIVRELKSQYSGLCQPDYVLDIPGGFGKVSIKRNNMVKHVDGKYSLIDGSGEVHIYNDTAI